MMLEEKIMSEMKEAMKSKNEAALRSLRAIKAEIIKAKTEPGAGGVVSPEAEIKMLQKMVKQRKDSIEIYQSQNRADLTQKEEEELAIIEQFLPKQMGAEELDAALKEIIASVGASGLADLGKVMGAATKQLAGKADGKAISAAVKALLS